MILVTGGTGLVGSHLLYDLCKMGKAVRALKRSTSNIQNLHKTFSYYTSTPETYLKQIEWVDADLLDSFSLLDALKGITEVYHCAAMVSYEPQHQEELKRINIEGTANMVNAALEKGIRKFCYVSSIAAIGRAKDGQLTDETSTWKFSPDTSNYSLSKYGAEREVWRASEEGLNVIIVNPSIIIGGGNWTQSSSNLFSKAYKGLQFYTDGGNGFVDVRDVSALMIKLMNSEIKNQRYILNSENSSFKNVFDCMHVGFNKNKPSIKAGKFLSEFAWRADKIRSAISGKPPLITKETAQSANKTSVFSNKKIMNTFPDYAFIPLEQAITDTCKLFLKDLEKK